MKLLRLIDSFFNWLFQEQDENKAAVRYQQADKIAREQQELIQNKE